MNHIQQEEISLNDEALVIRLSKESLNELIK